MSHLTVELPGALIARFQRVAEAEHKRIEEVVSERLMGLSDLLVEESGRSGAAFGAPERPVEGDVTPWLEADLCHECPGYDWGGLDPLALGRPVRCASDQGLTVNKG